MKQAASAGRNSRSNGISTEDMRPARRQKRFALCLDNGAYPASLERWKIYQVRADSDAEAHRQLRIVDESGTDYLYPRAFFRLVELPASLVRLWGRRARRSLGRAAIRKTSP